MVPKSAFNKTIEEEAVKDHPSGCGCIVAGASPGGSLAATAAGFLGSRSAVPAAVAAAGSPSPR